MTKDSAETKHGKEQRVRVLPIIATILIFGTLILLATFLENKWYSYLIILLSICALWFVTIKWNPAGLRKAALWAAAITAAVLAMVLCRPDPTVSFGGNMVSSGLRLISHITSQKNGETMFRSFLTAKAPDYVFGSWEVPEGYTNAEITLTKSRGYLLTNEQGNHEKVVYQLHGGGYLGKFIDNYNNMAVNYSAAYDNADVFSLDYRTAPDNPYPSALEDAVEGYEWLLENGYKEENIIFCGDSAGGGLSLATAMYLRDNGMKLPKLLILISPWTDLTASGESYKTKILSDALFGSKSVETAPRYPVPITYAGDHNPADPYISPAFGNYEKLPPMLIQVGEDELLLSDSLTPAQKAEAAGTDVSLIQYPGMYHTFCIITPWIRESREVWTEIADFIAAYQ